MGFIDRPEYYGGNRLDKTAEEKLDYNNKSLVNVWALDVSIDAIREKTISNNEVVKQSILNILLTLKGERLFNLNFGTNIFAYLFEDYVDVSLIKKEIITAIHKYEQRVTISLNDIEIIASPDDHSIEVNMAYYIKDSREICQLKEKLYM